MLCVWYVCVYMHVHICVGKNVGVHLEAQGWQQVSFSIAVHLTYWGRVCSGNSLCVSLLPRTGIAGELPCLSGSCLVSRALNLWSWCLRVMLTWQVFPLLSSPSVTPDFCWQLWNLCAAVTLKQANPTLINWFSSQPVTSLFLSHVILPQQLAGEHHY